MTFIYCHVSIKQSKRTLYVTSIKSIINVNYCEVIRQTSCLIATLHKDNKMIYASHFQNIVYTTANNTFYELSVISVIH